MRLLRHSAVLARRSLIGTWRTPEALVDVTIQPIIFLLLFTYVFGGAISGGSQHDYLQFLLPGILAQTIAQGAIAIGVNLNTDLGKGIFDRFKSLPIARIVEVRDNVFFAELALDGGITVSARSSDAIALALRAGCPILGADDVLEQGSIPVPHEDEDEVEQFREFLDQVSAEDFEQPPGGTRPGEPST